MKSMFVWRYALRQWNKDKFQTLILILGFALFCAFSMTLIATTPSLLSDRQPWMSSQSRYVTIGLESHDGSFRATDKQNLDKYVQSPAIDKLMKIASRTLDLTDQNGRVLKRAPTIYLDDTFITKFSGQLPKVYQKLNGNNLLISHDYWESIGRPPIDGLVLKVTLTGVSYPVAGVLPSKFKLFQGLNTDIIMTERQLSATYGIRFGKNKPPAEQMQNIIAGLLAVTPMRYGIAELKPGYTAEDVTAIAQEEAQLQDSDNVVLLSQAESWKPVSVSGLQFHPQYRQSLLEQWQILLGLTVAFLIIGLFNLLTSNLSRFLQRDQEFQTRKAVGATSQSLLQQLAIENALLGIVAAGIGIAVGWFVLGQIEERMALVAQLTLGMKILALTLSAVFTLLLSIAVGLLPFIVLNRREKFSRSRTSGQSKFQSILNSANMIAQISLALVAIVCSVSLWLTQEARLNSLPLRTDLEQLTYEVTGLLKDNHINLAEWNTKLAKDNLEVALSLTGFANTKANATKIGLDSISSPATVPMQVMPVSNNFFSVLDVKNLAGQQNPSGVNRVVINQAAAQQLGFDAPHDALNQQIYVEDATAHAFVEDKPIVIAGVTEDLPHSSLNQYAQPMVYNLMNEGDKTITAISILAKPYQLDTVYAFLQQQTDDSGNAFKIKKDGNLWNLLKKQDSEWFLLSKLVLSLTLLVCSLAATSLYQQVVAYLIQRSHLYAVMRTVGAQVGDVVISITRALSPRLVVGLLLGTVMTFSISDWFEQKFHVNLLVIDYQLISLAIILLLVSISLIPAIWRQLLRPIQRIFRDE